MWQRCEIAYTVAWDEAGRGVGGEGVLLRVGDVSCVLRLGRLGWSVLKGWGGFGGLTQLACQTINGTQLPDGTIMKVAIKDIEHLIRYTSSQIRVFICKGLMEFANVWSRNLFTF